MARQASRAVTARVPNCAPQTKSNKRSKNSCKGRSNASDKTKRELTCAEEGQCYGNVRKRLGDGRFEVQCSDGTVRLARVRGKLWKRQWISPGDLVLVCLRAFQDARADLVLKFTPDEVRTLRRLGEVPIALAADGDEDTDADAQGGEEWFSFVNEEDLEWDEWECDDAARSVLGANACGRNAQSGPAVSGPGARFRGGLSKHRGKGGQA